MWVFDILDGFHDSLKLYPPKTSIEITSSSLITYVPKNRILRSSLSAVVVTKSYISSVFVRSMNATEALYLPMKAEMMCQSRVYHSR